MDGRALDDMRIFTFWEPRNAIPPYIKLCLNTWERHLPGYEIVILDYANLSDYLSQNTYDPILFEKFPLMLQKDAIEVAILEKYGGIFMDADTIALGDIRPILQNQQHSDVVMFWEHLAFVIAKKHAPMLGLWRNEIQKRLQEFKSGGKVEIAWDFLGNDILSQLIKQFAKHHVCRLDKIKYGYTPETIYWRHKGRVIDQYLNFWFREDLELDHVFFKNQSIIALHNSWTPPWYKNLSESEVLRSPCLLSKTLYEVLNNLLADRMRHGVPVWKQLGILKNRLLKKVGCAT